MRHLVTLSKRCGFFKCKLEEYKTCIFEFCLPKRGVVLKSIHQCNLDGHAYRNKFLTGTLFTGDLSGISTLNLDLENADLSQASLSGMISAPLLAGCPVTITKIRVSRSRNCWHVYADRFNNGSRYYNRHKFFNRFRKFDSIGNILLSGNRVDGPVSSWLTKN